MGLNYQLWDVSAEGRDREAAKATPPLHAESSSAPLQAVGEQTGPSSALPEATERSAALTEVQELGVAATSPSPGSFWEEKEEEYNLTNGRFWPFSSHLESKPLMADRCAATRADGDTSSRSPGAQPMAEHHDNGSDYLANGSRPASTSSSIFQRQESHRQRNGEEPMAAAGRKRCLGEENSTDSVPPEDDNKMANSTYSPNVLRATPCCVNPGCDKNDCLFLGLQKINMCMAQSAAKEV